MMTDALHLATRARRLLATLIDMVIVPTVTIFFVMVFGLVEHPEDFQDRWWVFHVLLTAIGSYIALNGYLLWKHGQTLGKRAMNIAIVCGSDNTQPPALWKLLVIRASFFPLLFMSIIPWLFLLPLLDQLLIFGKRRRCGHDWLCNSLVVVKTG